MFSTNFSKNLLQFCVKYNFKKIQDDGQYGGHVVKRRCHSSSSQLKLDCCYGK